MFDAAMAALKPVPCMGDSMIAYDVYYVNYGVGCI